MRQTTKARHTLGIRGQLMWFLCFICLFLLGLFWLLSTQLLEPLYTKHIETQLTNQADSIVERLDDAIAEGKVLSSWSFGQLAVNSDFFDKLTLELYTKGSLNSFCVDISDTTLHTIYKIENQSFCNLHGTYLSDSANNDKIIATALAMRRKCRSVGSFVQTLNPPRLSGSAQLLVGRITADGSYTVLVTTSLVHVTEAGKVLSTLLPLAAALIFGFAMSAAWLFSEWFTKPLRQLSSAARQMALGNYAVQVDNRRNDELGDLARDFNHMAEEVQHAVQMQRDLLANVSHDLRTPLTSIYGSCSTVIDNYDSLGREQKIKLLSEACADAQWLNRMVENLLSVTRIDADGVAIQKTPTVLEELVDTVLVRFQKLHPGVPVEVKLPDDFIVIPMDSMLIQQVLTNLLENAVLHAKGMTCLTLRVFTLGQRAVFEVIDNGCGIPEEYQQSIFQPFFRVDKSRSREKGGVGLGLSLVWEIAHLHGGSVRITESGKDGTVIELTLPISAEEQGIPCG